MSSSIKYNTTIQLFRQIAREIKGKLINKSPTNKIKASNDPTIQHMLDLMRENQVTEKRFCRPQDHYKYFAETYLTYLKSSRVQDELTNKYFNKGEKSVEESARMVGLDLPKQNHT